MTGIRGSKRNAERVSGVRLFRESDGLGGIGFAGERLPADDLSGPDSRRHPDRILKGDIASLATAMSGLLPGGVDSSGGRFL
jgi:hypothetical protein